jgi:nickel/cobalt exporter
VSTTKTIQASEMEYDRSRESDRNIQIAAQLVVPDMSNAALKFLRVALTCLGLPIVLVAHPMGNFSVSHYSRLYLKSDVTELTYVLDLAEIPAFQLLESWRIDWKDEGLLQAKSEQQAAEWLDNLVLMQDGRRLPLRLISVSPTAIEGAGGLPVLRVSISAETVLKPGEVAYEDHNYPGRAGWKEIVIDHDQAVAIEKASQSGKDISKALTFYPTDPAITQPQDLTALVDWSPLRPKVAPVALSAIRPSAIPPSVAAPVTPAREKEPVPFSQSQSAGPGSVVKGDFLSKMLQRRELGGGLILLGILVAFGLGAMHAMSPGHGKTIVAAYLVGSRGTLKHAGLLGFMVTFTHTFTVFLLGLGILFFQRFFDAGKIVPLLGAVSGMSIVSVGLMLLYKRANALMEGAHHSHAHHSHAHHSHQPPARTRIAELRAAASGQPLADHQHESSFVHSHDGSTHSHTIEGEITPGSLIALGISGGIVPCPSALILMLSAIALGHPGVGLILLIGFSTGLALVLMACGALAIYAKHLLPTSAGMVNEPLFRLLPVFSAVIVICLGLVMTGVSAGWIQPLRFLS